MSWMDSWSRPGKSQATPTPYYLLPGGESTPYCRSCGRVISSRRTTTHGGPNTSSNAPSYCSQRCRNTKPRRLDREIEATFARMLSVGEEVAGGNDRRVRQLGKAKKGDPRIVVSCDEVEKAVFGSHTDSEKTFGRRKNRASRVLPAADEEESNAPIQREDLIEDRDGAVALDDDKDSTSIDGDILARMAVRSGTRIRPPQEISLVNGSVGGEKGRAERAQESEDNMRKRLEGQRRAQQREMVRGAARRLVVFGLAVEGNNDATAATTTRTRKCEAVMQGKVVEPSYAKGDWGIRWRE